MKNFSLLALGLFLGSATGCGVQGISLDPGVPDLATQRSGGDLKGVDMPPAQNGFVFNFPTDIPVGVSLGTPRLADLNGDGKLDLVAIGGIPLDGGLAHVGTTVLVALGNGDGTFAAAVPYTAYANGDPFPIVTGDFNQDGKLDIAVSDFGTSVDAAKLSVLLGNGDGTFRAPKYTAIGLETETLAVADFDGDDKLDFVTRGTGNTGVSLYHGNGDGTFSEHPIPGTDTTLVTALDSNGDGKQDLLVNNDSGNQVLLNAGGGNFTLSSVVTMTGGLQVASGDLDGNGGVDVVYTNTPGLNVFLNEAGGFSAAKLIAVSSTANGVALGDLNGDGALDIVVTDGLDLTVILHN